MPFNATTTCNPDGSGTVCTTIYGASTSTTPSIVNGFTYGEIVDSTFLFLIFVTVLYTFFYNSIKAKKVK